MTDKKSIRLAVQTLEQSLHVYTFFNSHEEDFLQELHQRAHHVT